MVSSLTAVNQKTITERDSLSAIIVHQFSDNRNRNLAAIDELALLVSSAGADVKFRLIVNRRTPVSATYIGKGSVDALADYVNQYSAGLVIFNHPLSPVQERNLENRLQTRVLDRTRLILDIFAQRAVSHAGKLQVELAQLKHMSTRLIRGWTHLERQKGGIGLRGPGETQLETDRRLIGKRIRSLQARLEKVGAHRALQRRARKRIPIPVISLVGYTNAGKSTLFNRLTESKVYAADQLFATLDPVMRKLELPETGPVILSDTVGFISDLPHTLVSAFHSTLEEVANAQVLLHVMDVGDERLDELNQQVDSVLDEIGAGEVTQIHVYNKIDQTELQPRYQPANLNTPAKVWVSAVNGDGEELLLQAIADHFIDSQVQLCIKLPPKLARLRASFYANQWIRKESINEKDGSIVVNLSLTRKQYNKLISHKDFQDCEVL